MEVEDIQLSKEQYDALINFERIPTVDDHSAEECSCEKVEKFHSVCIPASREIFCFQVCNNGSTYVAHVNEMAFLQSIGKDFSKYLSELEA